MNYTREAYMSTLSYSAVLAGTDTSVSGGYMVEATRTEGGDPSPGRHVVFVNRNGTTEETA